MLNKKHFFRSVSLGMTTVVLVGAGLLSGCTSPVDKNAANKPEDKNPPAVEESKQDKIMPEFMAIAEKKPQPDVIIQFIDKNIAGVSEKDAAVMLEELEKAQKNYLPALEEKFYGESIQKSISEIFMTDFDLEKVYDTEDAELKGLLGETRDMGYKVETAEGMFFPIINYEFMKKYSPYAAEDMKAYIDIMAEETNKVPAKDAALVIGWNEIIDRILAQEAFTGKYADSSMAESVKELQKKYTVFMLFGLNNTPLFSYDTNTMDPEAKEIYTKAVKDNPESKAMQLLGKYMEILDKSNYKLTDEADKFRKDAAGSN